MRRISVPLSFATMDITIIPVGTDLAVLLSGGERPHIGCAVVAVPRASLTGDGSVSCTSSVLNLTGHKDEALCRFAAETLCRRRGVTVTCIGGFHQDNITKEQIQEVKAQLALALERTGV